jgi:threonine dehydrogenase-like Zn-dependent dehydrogenase
VRIHRSLSAKRLGAEQIRLMSRHTGRTDLGTQFGATDVVAERGDEGIQRVRELIGGDGTHAAIECVGTKQSMAMAVGVVRDGGVISRLGAAQYDQVSMGFGTTERNFTLSGGIAPARAYIEELTPDILVKTDRLIEYPPRHDPSVEVPDGCRAMADRRGLKVLIES